MLAQLAQLLQELTAKPCAIIPSYFILFVYLFFVFGGE
jgi:hypothetical protein